MPDEAVGSGKAVTGGLGLGAVVVAEGSAPASLSRKRTAAFPFISIRTLTAKA
jgi:hypothetical protein